MWEYDLNCMTIKNGLDSLLSDISNPYLYMMLWSALCFTDSEHLCAAHRACTLGGWFAVLHSYRPGVLHFPLSTAFHTICLHMVTSFLWLKRKLILVWLSMVFSSGLSGNTTEGAFVIFENRARFSSLWDSLRLCKIHGAAGAITWWTKYIRRQDGPKRPISSLATIHRI